MVERLPEPVRPLRGGRIWRWRPSGRPWVRVWRPRPGAGAATPRTVGPLARFDPHEPSADGRARDSPSGRGTLYLAQTLRGALAEVFGSEPRWEIDAAWRASLLLPEAEVDLINLRGSGAALIGALPGLGSGPLPRAETRAWARAIYEDLPGAAGIRYSAAHEETPCLCLWGRAPALRIAEELPLHHEPLWRRVEAAALIFGAAAVRS